MARAFNHYGWKVSPYTAKTRAYLTYQSFRFNDIEPTALALYGQIKPQIGRIIMPTVKLNDGQWIQDSSNIIDHFEENGCRLSGRPSGPVQAFASSLLEVFADEWLPMAALHYRWNIEQNHEYALNEFSRSGFPWLPRLVGRRLIRPMADKMRSYLPVLGVSQVTIPGVEETTLATLTCLNTQLSQTPYVFGWRACIGDFALFGPLWAHLYRDPGSRHLFDSFPAVREWIDRLKTGYQADGQFVENDQIPAALAPLFALIMDDQWAWINTLVTQIDRYCSDTPDARRVPRALGVAPFTIRGLPGERKLITGVQWKAQRVRRCYDAAPDHCEAWLRTLPAHDGKRQRVIPTIKNRLTYHEHAMVLEAPLTTPSMD
ncbi:MAG: glutathione S-transferase N-terminal domain-containing protein [Myxococcota bacterium]|nr:glutathione S-transferase N-terminal domain-containing protein [Myxococcota bacterium]